MLLKFSNWLLNKVSGVIRMVHCYIIRHQRKVTKVAEPKGSAKQNVIGAQRLFD